MKLAKINIIDIIICILCSILIIILTHINICKNYNFNNNDTPFEQRIKGDVNNDGSIDVLDIIKINLYIKNKNTNYSLLDLYCMDIDNNLYINEEDINTLNNIILELD